MKVLSIFSLLLSATTLVGAQTVPPQTEASVIRPLNLSVRKPLAPVTDATVIWVDPKATASDTNPVAGAESRLPYGSGFESRQQGNSSAGGGSGSGSGGGGNSGNGGGGRGGSGRGR